MNYSKVQFISWEVNTGPTILTSPLPPFNFLGGYVGLRLNGQNDARLDVTSQCVDIQTRVAFTADAVSKALQIADPSPNTLKVFMAPEFLYRGAGGAYLNDLLNGWTGVAPAEFNLPAPFNANWSGLFGGLKQIAANDNYKNWVFVFGTAISASFPTVQGNDGKYYLDYTQLAEIYNTSLVQAGGAANTAVNYASRKHYISGIDFLKWYTHTWAIQYKENTVLPADPQGLIPADVLGVPEGGAVFTLAGVNDGQGNPITFGLEVCLDHEWSGGNFANHFGRIRTANQYVKIQLVPSAGMELKADSIRLQPGAGAVPTSYAFNCDGLNNLPLAGTDGCHTQVWNGANGAAVQPANRLYENNNNAAVAASRVANVTAQIPVPWRNPVQGNELWKNGSGSVRAINSLPL